MTTTRTVRRLLLLGHVAGRNLFVRALQRLVERHSLRLAGDHQTRTTGPLLRAAGFRVAVVERRWAGVIERVVAVRPE